MAGGARGIHGGGLLSELECGGGVAGPEGARGVLRAGFDGGRAHVKAAAEDHDAVVDGFIGLDGLEGVVGIFSGGGVLAAGHVSGAEDHDAIDDGGNIFRSAEPTGIGVGEMMAADAVGFRVDFRIDEVGEPALLVRDGGLAMLLPGRAAGPNRHWRR